MDGIDIHALIAQPATEIIVGELRDVLTTDNLDDTSWGHPDQW